MCKPPSSMTFWCWFCHSAFVIPDGSPPKTMSTPLPAMLVATVTAPGAPAWEIISASFSWFFALRTWCLILLFFKNFVMTWFWSMDLVPIRIGWPSLLLSATSSIILEYLALWVLWVGFFDWFVGGNYYYVEIVDFFELLFLGNGGTGHTSKFLVHSEVVL